MPKTDKVVYEQIAHCANVPTERRKSKDVAHQNTADNNIKTIFSQKPHYLVERRRKARNKSVSIQRVQR